MQKMSSLVISLAVLLLACSGADDPLPVPEKPDLEIKWEISPASTTLSSGGETKNIIVQANGNWTVTSNRQWSTLSPGSGGNGQTVVKITAPVNPTDEIREAELTFVSGEYSHTYQVAQEAGELVVEWSLEPRISDFPSAGDTKSITITSNADWQVSSNQPWVSLSTGRGEKGVAVIEATVTSNTGVKNRIAELSFVSGNYSRTHYINQEADIDENYVPAGYTMVWSEEFNAGRLNDGKPALPDTGKWWYEVMGKGAVNNELQTYVDNGFRGTDTVAAVHDGTLKIIAQKNGNDIISARVNTTEAWTYGYFEARLRVPGGKGTWPAFWMMPRNFENWPLDGEIDIMEYVGYQPNVVHATVHTHSYNHMIGTQKGASRTIENAEIQFHVYAVEWTPDYIKGFVDGEEYFHFDNDGTGNKHTWPFDAPFYLKLNLAWGGDWGGAQGVDETKLPAVYEIDYVRVYQK